MKIQTLHPDQNKQGTNIDKEKYEIVKSAILHTLKKHGELSFKELSSKAKTELLKFEGSKGWYITTVKLDLEARNVISVDRNSKPQIISLPLIP